MYLVCAESNGGSSVEIMDSTLKVILRYGQGQEGPPGSGICNGVQAQPKGSCICARGYLYCSYRQPKMCKNATI